MYGFLEAKAGVSSQNVFIINIHFKLDDSGQSDSVWPCS